jgi:hypothetical protein
MVALSLLVALLSATGIAQGQPDSSKSATWIIEPTLRTLDIEASTLVPFFWMNQAALVFDMDFIHITAAHHYGVGLRLAFARQTKHAEGGDSPSYENGSSTSISLRLSRLEPSTRDEVYLGYASSDGNAIGYDGTSAFVLGADVRHLIIPPVASLFVGLNAFYAKNPANGRWQITVPGIVIGISLGYID